MSVSYHKSTWPICFRCLKRVNVWPDSGKCDCYEPAFVSAYGSTLERRYSTTDT